ncbi:hypothetical protein EVAR_18323_1 [Eumeta japonica]|uniref:Uncharacterized protein n=1 Tax=Eumeta variegata TaxID=151549 RepID=A0A4C1V8J9_EUMVA|nr:hypothetical protein EVAR_18323_1 [Eumeta japonica]
MTVNYSIIKHTITVGVANDIINGADDVSLLWPVGEVRTMRIPIRQWPGRAIVVPRAAIGPPAHKGIVASAAHPTRPRRKYETNGQSAGNRCFRWTYTV